MNTICKKASVLKAKVKAIIAKNEYNTVRFCGVGNITRSDLDTICLYCDTIATYGGYSGALMQPRGPVADVLAKNGLLEA